jgi:hypothetical protein
MRFPVEDTAAKPERIVEEAPASRRSLGRVFARPYNEGQFAIASSSIKAPSELSARLRVCPGSLPSA